MVSKKQTTDPFVTWFRDASPYIHAHRGRTFVVCFGGEAVADRCFPNLIHDLAILQGLGIRLVLVHGARPQVEERLQTRGAKMQYIDGLRVTDDAALACVKEAAGAVRVEIEALLSMGLSNSPMAGARIRAASGNFVTAKPIGVRNGTDYGHTGEVRRVDSAAIEQRLETGAIAIIPPIGYSPTGEVFNLSAADVAASVAIALGADKLISLVEGKGLTDSRGRLITNVVPRDVDTILSRRKRLAEDICQHLRAAVTACRSGVNRIHLLDRKGDGALLQELFTRDGSGTLITAEPYEETRTATIDDVGGLLELLEPLEAEGTLVRRSRELLETEIERFTLMERDGMAIACAALYPYAKEQIAELACVVVHPDYRDGGRGDWLLEQMETTARAQGIRQLFLLTTHTAHWFRERGFVTADLKSLPIKRRQLYNYQRNSKVLIKQLSGS
ncbi:MAG: N-acetylglutamate synthase [Gammaproteobacteria bacterium (ex Lamellibrachia satsuma)]|nr:MAG: amino-acid N-acetyltransferase [Gammaproteobacteria bacterium (ex Lamellibrachia satsuma)]RRS34449.1 MAG: N-acetylglutamate synthase [Gammaproteobacteria bacterium (ex Lamellibrachia satsuma)]RRS35111.1 MAG: N-acetylglutamate synthase [Gammaproteobacteria bacterium (ex Lamellibrachia satsuma)]